MTEAFRLATFNVENLLQRYRFRAGPEPVGPEGLTAPDAFQLHDETTRQLKARAIREVDADVLCLQEVESLRALDHFASRYLAPLRYRYRVALDGADPRQLGLGVLSRFPIVNLRSYRHVRNQANTGPLFPRDCLGVHLAVRGRMLLLFAAHLKSMAGGRAATHDLREEQIGYVAKLVDTQLGPAFTSSFAVVGDLGDYMDAATSVDALVDHPYLVNVVDRLEPELDRWTHHWAGGEAYRQLDYLLLGKAFDQRAGKPTPTLCRAGLPFRAARHVGPRYDEVGESVPKASDHAPLAVDIPISALDHAD